MKLGSDWLKEQQVRSEEVKQSLAKELKQLENTNLRLSEGLDRLSSINAEVNKQKAVREQINAEIRELDTRIEERKEELRREPSEIVTAKQEGIAKGKKIAINEILNTAELQFKTMMLLPLNDRERLAKKDSTNSKRLKIKKCKKPIVCFNTWTMR